MNRLEQAVKGNGETSSYLYNGLGHRVGKDIGRIENAAGAQRESDKMLQGTGFPDPFSRLEGQELCPERRIRYIIDLTKGYHNLLQKEEEAAVQTFLWDGNVAGMWEDTGASADRTAGRHAYSAALRYYLQDELGSPIRLFGKEGGLEESYGYDEFGQDLYGNQGLLQPFGYTGYQADQTAGTYYAQAREYRAELGRFAAVDKYLELLSYPYNLNRYMYCYSNPLKYLDRSGNVSEEEAKKIIKENSEDIIKYAEMYDVDPQVVAGCIYVEQIENVDWKDSLDSMIAIMTGLDTSIGIGQVKVSTAKLLEDEGCVERTEGRKWYECLISGMSRRNKIIMKLGNDKENIQYVAAYLKRQIDVWQEEYPEISDDISILGTTYNLGHEIRGKGILGYVFGFGNKPRIPHSNPQPNSFGLEVEKNYDLMGELLGGKCVE